MNAPKVSVSIIVAAYNAQSTIAHCVASILEHNAANLELIVVDDYSSDQTADIVQEYAARDSRLRYIKNADVKGASAARNVGLAQACGEYVLFLDADDWMLVSAIDTLLASARRTDADLSIAAHVQYRGQDSQRLNNFGRKTETVYQGQGILDCLFEYLERPYQNVMLVHCWGRLFKKAIIDKHGIRFEPRLNQLEDLNFVFNYICHITKIAFLPQGLYFHRINNDGRSMSAQTGMDDRVPEKFSHAFRALDKCLNTFAPGNAQAIQARVGATVASFLILTVLRLCRVYIRHPSAETYQRVKAIASAEIFQARLAYLRPQWDEAVLLYWACRTKRPALVFMAGLLRTYYLRLRSTLAWPKVGIVPKRIRRIERQAIFSTFRASHTTE